jgi:hypothetical protein
MANAEGDGAPQRELTPKSSDRVRNGVGCALMFFGPLLAGVLTIVILTVNTALGSPPLLQLIGDIVASADAVVATLSAAIGGFLFPGPMPQRAIAAAGCGFIGYIFYAVVLGFGGPIF